ncbi:hypothetical protein U2F10_33520 [Leptothoe sp. EHU-05/26/07-4]
MDDIQRIREKNLTPGAKKLKEELSRRRKKRTTQLKQKTRAQERPKHRKAPGGKNKRREYQRRLNNRRNGAKRANAKDIKTHQQTDTTNSGSGTGGFNPIYDDMQQGSAPKVNDHQSSHNAAPHLDNPTDNKPSPETDYAPHPIQAPVTAQPATMLVREEEEQARTTPDEDDEKSTMIPTRPQFGSAGLTGSMEPPHNELRRQANASLRRSMFGTASPPTEIDQHVQRQYRPYAPTIARHYSKKADRSRRPQANRTNNASRDHTIWRKPAKENVQSLGALVDSALYHADYDDVFEFKKENHSKHYTPAAWFSTSSSVHKEEVLKLLRDNLTNTNNIHYRDPDRYSVDISPTSEYSDANANYNHILIKYVPHRNDRPLIQHVGPSTYRR